MWFIFGLLAGVVCGIVFRPYILKAWEWIKSKFSKK